MKRCPQCNRLEFNETLGFCRVDGTPLVADSSSSDTDAGTRKLGSGPVVSESVTNRLSDANTNISNVRPTGPTTILPEQLGTERTGKLIKPKSRRLLIGSVVAVLVVAAAAYAYYVSHKAQNVIGSIAVMPFVNESGNADVEYLSDGMTETLISSLSQLPNLNVKARSSVFRYKGKEMDPKKIGKELERAGDFKRASCPTRRSINAKSGIGRCADGERYLEPAIQSQTNRPRHTPKRDCA